MIGGQFGIPSTPDAPVLPPLRDDSSRRRPKIPDDPAGPSERGGTSPLPIVFTQNHFDSRPEIWRYPNIFPVCELGLGRLGNPNHSFHPGV